MVRTLFLFRHLRTDANERSEYNSAHDELSRAGIIEGKRAAAWFATQHFDAIYASPLRRIAQTAEILGVVPIIDSRLADIEFGSFAGKPFGSIANYCTEHGLNHRTFVLPGGESHAQVGERVVAFIDALPPNGTFLLLTHSAVIQEVARLHGCTSACPENGALWVIVDGKLVHENWTPWGI